MSETNAAAKKATLERHRSAFDVWFLIHRALEDAVVLDRKVDGAFARALDFLFVQAFKSHGSLYLLCVAGHCEDAATIARRIFEIALQTAYLESEEPERENRGKHFLAYYFHLVPGILASPSVTSEERRRWQQLYDKNKKWLKFTKAGKPASTWSGLAVADLAAKLKMQQAYDQDYRFLSNMAHGSSAGSLLRITGGKIEITDDTAATPVLVYGTRYMLAVTEVWNRRFNLIEDSRMDQLKERCLNFDFQTAKNLTKSS